MAGFTTPTLPPTVTTHTTHTRVLMGTEGPPTGHTAAHIGGRRTTPIQERTRVGQPNRLRTVPGALPRPTTPIQALLRPLGRALMPTDHGASRWSIKMARRPTRSMPATPTDRSEQSRPQRVAKGWLPVTHMETPLPERPPTATCTPATTAMFIRTPVRAGRLTT